MAGASLLQSGPAGPDAGPPAGDPPAPPAPAKPGGWALRLRILSSIVFVPLLIVLARTGGFVFLAFVATEVGFGLFEFYGMMFRKGLQPYVRLGLAAALGLLWVTYRPHTPQVDFLASAVLLLTLALELRRP